MPQPSEVVIEAAQTGQDVRLHLRDGEVVVARVLWHDDQEFIYAAITSSHPERYAVCDSTGTTLRFDALTRASFMRS